MESIIAIQNLPTSEIYNFLTKAPNRKVCLPVLPPIRGLLCNWRHFVVYMAVQPQFLAWHVQTFTLLPCKIWTKASIHCDNIHSIDPILYNTHKEGHQPSVAACRVETQSKNLMQHVYEKARAADSRRSLAVREWGEHRTIRVNGALSHQCSGEKPRRARVEKQLFLVNAAQTNTSAKWKVILLNLWALWIHNSRVWSVVTPHPIRAKFNKPVPCLAGPFFYYMQIHHKILRWKNSMPLLYLIWLMIML